MKKGRVVEPRSGSCRGSIGTTWAMFLHVVRVHLDLVHQLVETKTTVAARARTHTHLVLAANCMMIHRSRLSVMFLGRTSFTWKCCPPEIWTDCCWLALSSTPCLIRSEAPQFPVVPRTHTHTILVPSLFDAPPLAYLLFGSGGWGFR